ncbi:MAG: response regulator [Chloroflexota bacterium]
MENKGEILWIDDEIELLKPHIILLKQRGYGVDTATNGEDAIEMLRDKRYHLIFLDENMVGISGLETLPLLKDIDPSVKIVMVTKNEAESVMEDAIGSKIDDYLTKPVNPAQIILACKKFLEGGRIEEEKFTQTYLRGFSEITMKIMEKPDWQGWKDIYVKLTNWTVELDKFPDSGLKQTISDQMKAANTEFSKFVENNYRSWLTEKSEEADPVLSPHLLDRHVLPLLKDNQKVALIVVDCMRYDQWLMMQELLMPLFNFKTDFYSSILPTATPYARNAIFSGLYPSQIKKYFPQFWNVDSNSEDHKQNAFEKELLETWIERRRVNLKNKPVFIKIFDTDFGKKIEREISSHLQNQFVTIVINAVDMIAHSRSDYAILKEIAPDEAAYRTLTSSWFRHSSLLSMLKAIAEKGDMKVVMTTDHGSIRCLRGVKVIGDRDTSTNLRYKFGKNVKSESRYAMQLANPEEFKIPASGITVNNLIAKEDYYFVYPTDYHQFLNKYRDSFQHGGISLEEMIIPIIQMDPK